MTGWLGGGAGSKSVPNTPLRPTHQNIFNSVRSCCAFSVFEWEKWGSCMLMLMFGSSVYSASFTNATASCSICYFCVSALA